VVEDGGGVVVETGGAAFEEGGDEDNFLFGGDLTEKRGGRAGDRFGGVEEARAAWRTSSAALLRFSWVSTPQDIWMRAIFL
jgi:hypothetical protein